MTGAARVAESVDAADSKSAAARLAGSSPATGTIISIEWRANAVGSPSVPSRPPNHSPGSPGIRPCRYPAGSGCGRLGGGSVPPRGPGGRRSWRYERRCRILAWKRSLPRRTGTGPAVGARRSAVRLDRGGAFRIELGSSGSDGSTKRRRGRSPLGVRFLRRGLRFGRDGRRFDGRSGGRRKRHDGCPGFGGADMTETGSARGRAAIARAAGGGVPEKLCAGEAPAPASRHRPRGGRLPVRSTGCPCGIRVRRVRGGAARRRGTRPSLRACRGRGGPAGLWGRAPRDGPRPRRARRRRPGAP